MTKIPLTASRRLPLSSAATAAALPARRLPPPDDGDDNESEGDDVHIHDGQHWPRLIRSLCNADDSRAALALLDRLHRRGYRASTHDLTAVTLALCRAGRYADAHRRLLLSSYAPPDHPTADLILAHLLRGSAPGLTSLVLDHFVALDPSFAPSLAVHNRLIHQFAVASRPADAQRVFENLRSPTAVSYTSLVGGYCKAGDLISARRVFDEMVQRGVLPNSLTYSVLLKGVLRKRNFEEAARLMSEMWTRMEVRENPNIKTAAFANLVDALCREGMIDEIFHIAETMPQGESICKQFAYGEMIDSLCKYGKNHGASRIVYMMRKKGFTPSMVSYNSIVHGLAKQGEGGCLRAFQLFEEGAVLGYAPHEATYKMLVERLCELSEVGKAKKVMQCMLLLQGVDRVRVYNIFLGALCLIDDPSDLLNMLVEMLQNDCQPDIVTLNTLLHGLCKSGRISEALSVFSDMKSGKFSVPDVVSFTTIINCLLDAGRVEEGLNFLHHKMPESSCSPNVVTYNAVLRGLCKNGMIDKAMDEFKDMLSKGICADCTTHTVIIDGLCSEYQIEEMKSFWRYVVWPSNMHDDFVYAAILRGLCNTGKLSEACDFLYELVDCGLSPKIVNFNILIDQACKLGQKKEVYEMVREMKKNGLTPDAVTWRILNKLHDDTKNNDPLEDVMFSDNASILEEAHAGTSLHEQANNKLFLTLSAVGNCSLSSAKENAQYFRKKKREPVPLCNVDPKLVEEDEHETVREDFRRNDKSCVQSVHNGSEPLSKLARRVFGLL